MKFTFKMWLLFVIASALEISCGKDFLDVPTSSTLIRQDYIKDLQTTQEYLNGVYVSLGPLLATSSVLYADFVADNVKPVTGSNMFSVHYNWTQVADDAPLGITYNLNQISSNVYNVVAASNFVIESASLYKQENESKANEMMGQALTIRALLHHLLVNLFAQPYSYTADASHPGIVYRTTSDWTVPINPRLSVAEVYKRLVVDLQQAIKLLPANTSSTLYISGNAARGLLARVLLAKEDYAGAKSLAREVSNQVPIMTTGYPAKLFTLQETEALFQIPQNTVNPVQFAGYYLRSFIQFVATSDIANLLNERTGDLRRSWITQSSGSWNITKYPQGVVPNAPTPSTSYFHTVIRSSEMYLIAAESYAQLGNSVDSARFYLDAIRKRADATVLPTTATGTALKDSIYKERRKELAFEGFRMFDLLRWKKGVVRKGETNPAIRELPYPSDKAIAPIPVKDVKLAGLAQNLGY